MNVLSKCMLLFLCITLLPFLTVGITRKTKAQFQGRIGAAIWQPYCDFFKLLQKGQTISQTTTWIFQASTATNLAIMLLISFIVPWLSFKPTLAGDDLFALLYLFALVRLMTMLAAMDPGTAFGGFGASREAYLSLLVEPALFIGLAALAYTRHSTSLGVIFDFKQSCSVFDVPVWFSAGLGLYLTSLVDLSRMPVDDPTTHLELTMVHEAMILENSGKNLALVELSHLLKMIVLYGLSAQCLLHGLSFLIPYKPTLFGILSVALILVLAFTTGVLESVLSKLQWRRTPEFVAYALTMSLFAMGGALIGGAFASHTL